MRNSMMKKIILAAALVSVTAASWAANLEFVEPDFDNPYYQIVVPFDVSAANTLIKSVQVNGRAWPQVYIVRDKKHVEDGKPLEPGRYAVHIDYAWKGGQHYAVTLVHAESTSGVEGQAPDGRGIAAGEEGHYRVLRLQEPVGLARERDIHCFTFAVPKDVFADGAFLLLSGSTPIEYQVLDAQECVPPEQVAADHPVTVTYKIAFPIDLPAHGKAMLVLVQGQKAAAGSPAFNCQVSGQGAGKTVAGDRVTVEFHPQSGQIHAISYPREGIKLVNPIGVMHWNPDIYIPGITWDHSFDWKAPPNYQELIGPHLYVNSRRGPLETIKQVTLDVKYTLTKEAPYVLSETLLQVNQDLGVVALRNDEMLVDRALFDSLIYKDAQGQIVQMPLQERPEFPDGSVHATADNVPWVGMLNTKQKYGFFSLRIDCLNSNLAGPGDSLNKAGTYFYAPSSGNYAYWVRPLVYTWAEYSTRKLLTHVRAGSLFYEKNAYVALPLEDGYAGQLDRLLLKLKNPVRIY
ncbi:MAG: hypothetical protein A2W31_18630 [Planctomycetes bacterium RBG_16_64_10]|nr:MAG: hypothetical protein A2W31_18630 [Planctomycetes bacterium RBG_16_64_10]